MTQVQNLNPAGKPGLSIIIPTLNEQLTLGNLLICLKKQTDIEIQIIIADGGSQDRTLEIATQYSADGMDITVLQCEAGRASQMNHGARMARYNTLLFIHSDSHIGQANLLHKGLNHLLLQQTRLGTKDVAGHFSLVFKQESPFPNKAYYFYESKTTLNRQDTINGDQGFMLHADFFNSLGCFDDSLPYMEDARLARKIFQQGHWVTLPGNLCTSARRFESEGLRQRQTLNAILCNFLHIGFLDFFEYAAQAYQQQDKTRKLQLYPFLQLIHRLLKQKGLRQSLRYWYLTGAYITGNAWQLFFLRDCNNNYQNRFTAGVGPTPWLNRHDRWIKPLLNLAPAKFITALLTVCWFYGLMALSKHRTA